MAQRSGRKIRGKREKYTPFLPADSICRLHYHSNEGRYYSRISIDERKDSRTPLMLINQHERRPRFYKLNNGTQRYQFDHGGNYDQSNTQRRQKIGGE